MSQRSLRRRLSRRTINNDNSEELLPSTREILLRTQQGTTVESTKELYKRCELQFLKFLRESEDFRHEVDGCTGLPKISPDAIIHGLTHFLYKYSICKITGNEIVTTRSLSNAQAFKSMIVKVYETNNWKLDESVLKHFTQYGKAAKRHIAELKQKGEYKRLEGKLGFSVDAYRRVGSMLIRNVSDLNCILFHVLSWNVVARAITVAEIMYGHLSWQGDAILISNYTHKGNEDGEGLEENPKYLYCNPDEPDVCPWLWLAVHFICNVKISNCNHIFGINPKTSENKFAYNIRNVLKNLSQQDQIDILGDLATNFGTQSNRKGNLYIFVNYH